MLPFEVDLTSLHLTVFRRWAPVFEDATVTSSALHSIQWKPTRAMPKKTSKREVIEPTKGDKRYVRRKADGTFGKTVDLGKSLSADGRP